MRNKGKIIKLEDYVSARGHDDWTKSHLSDKEKKVRRHFNTKEREALFITAQGKCQICGCNLEEINWEPDHIIPFCLGGITDVANGQALCLPCNRKKGAKTHEYE